MPYNSLTLFKYLYNKHWRFYFLTCTTCIVYQYFKELVASVSKAGAKVSGLFLTAKLFMKFFQFFSFQSVSQALCAKGKEVLNKKTVNRGTCESDCKDKDFYFYLPNFFGSFLSLVLSASALFTVSHFFKALLSWKAGAKVGAFTLHSKYITHFFSFIFGWIG